MKKIVEDVKAKVDNILLQYVVNDDKKEACRCIKDLKFPFFYHEIAKRALVMAMEIGSTEGLLLDLLKAASEEGLMYNSSQISEGFGRMVDGVDDLLLDIPDARRILQSAISKAASQGWLCASSLKSLVSTPVKGSLQDDLTRIYKLEAQSIIREYFLSGDISEVGSCLVSENNGCSTADDAALDNPGVVEDLAMFLAIAVVDEVLEPQHLEEIGTQFMGPKSIGRKILQMAKS